MGQIVNREIIAERTGTATKISWDGTDWSRRGGIHGVQCIQNTGKPLASWSELKMTNGQYPHRWDDKKEHHFSK